MLDDLRSSASEPPQLPPEEKPTPPPVEAGEKKPLLGMTPSQRFLVALLLLIISCILGTACLMVFGKINIPFF